MSLSDTSKRCLNCAWITVSLREGCGELEVQTTLIPVTTVGQPFKHSHARCGTEYYSMICVCYCTIFRRKGPEFPPSWRKLKVHYHDNNNLYRDKSNPHLKVVFIRWTVWTSGFRFPVRTRIFFLFSITSTSRAHPASCSVSTQLLSPGVKRPGSEGDQSPLLQPRLRMSGAILPLPLYTSMVQRGKIYFASAFTVIANEKLKKKFVIFF
jgi:hypothetical protein